MENSFTAIYKDGILKPLSKLNFKEKEKLVLKVISSKSVVQTTKGMINGNAAYLKEVAESEDLLEWNP